MKEIMSAENDRLAFTPEGCEIINDEKRCERIETGIGFVEDQQFGVMQQGPRDGCFALHPLGEFTGQLMFVRQPQ